MQRRKPTADIRAHLLLRVMSAWAKDMKTEDKARRTMR
jgi:hypothetical protein